MFRFPLQITITPEDTAVVNKFQENAKETIEHLASTPIEELLPELVRQAISFGIKVLIALLIYFIGAWLIKKIRKMLRKIFERRKTEKAIASFVESLTSISLTIILIIITIGTLGINTTSLAALIAAGGMAIGMALSGTVQNFAGGIMILVFKPFKAGDFIETENGYSGTVTDVSIVSTKLTTTDNKIIVIPNGSLSNGTIKNYSQNTMRRVEWLVGVEYGTSSKDVKAALQEIVDAEKRVVPWNMWSEYGSSLRTTGMCTTISTNRSTQSCRPEASDSRSLRWMSTLPARTPDRLALHTKNIHLVRGPVS